MDVPGSFDALLRQHGIQLPAGTDTRRSPTSYNASVYRDPAGKVLGVFAAARDVTT